MLDDFENFAGIGRWMEGTDSWWHAITSNQSGSLGRPVSMASFVAGVAILDGTAYSFKTINVAIHAVIGFLLYVLATQLLAKDQTVEKKHVPALGLIVATVWLFHPLHVSTTLYAVQRMTQLSALFVILSLISYVRLRSRLEHKANLGSALALLSVPTAFGLFATLSKENGLLFAPLCVVVEFVYFQATKRPRAAKAFILLFVALPTAVIFVYLSTHPQFIMGSYAIRDFTLTERILTQLRVVTDYLGQIVLPRSNSFGLYHDDIPLSSSLFAPITTLFSLILLSGLVVAAFAGVKRAPTVSAGIALFFVGHAMESTVIALEIFFEHRNYFPSVGIILSLVYIFYRMYQGGGQVIARMRPVLLGGFAAYIVLLGVQTNARAMVWNSQEALYQQSLLAHPSSMRTRLDFSTYLVRQNQHDRAIPILEPMLDSPDPVSRRLGALQILMLKCSFYNEGTREDLIKVFQTAPNRLTVGDVTSLEAFAGRVEGETCQRYTMQDVAELGAAFLSASEDDESAPMRWQLRWAMANIQYKLGNIPEARDHSLIAWATGVASPPVGGFAAELNVLMGKSDKAQEVLNQVRERVDSTDKNSIANIARIQRMIDESAAGQSEEGRR